VRKRSALQLDLSEELPIIRQLVQGPDNQHLMASEEPDQAKANAKLDDGRTQDLQIADALIADIVEWRYVPGAWIREREIAARFGVSHAPVREAFRHVAREGFVEVVPWRGARVTEIDVNTANDIFELWIATFAAICGRAATRMLDDEHAEMLRLLKIYEASIDDTADTMVHTRTAYAVGRYVADCARAPLIDQTLWRVGRLARWQHAMLPADQFEALQRAPGHESARRLRRLCGAIIAHDPEMARTEARDFLSLSVAYMVEAIARRPMTAADDSGAAKPKRARKEAKPAPPRPSKSA